MCSQPAADLIGHDILQDSHLEKYGERVNKILLDTIWSVENTFGHYVEIYQAYKTFLTLYSGEGTVNSQTVNSQN